MRNSTSFTPATAPKGKGGSKHHLTKIKEAVGLANFQTLIDFVDGEGAGRFLRELEALEGRDYVAAYLKLLEFVKPKPRHEAPQEPLPIERPSNEILDEIAAHIRANAKPPEP